MSDGIDFMNMIKVICAAITIHVVGLIAAYRILTRPFTVNTANGPVELRWRLLRWKWEESQKK